LLQQLSDVLRIYTSPTSRRTSHTPSLMPSLLTILAPVPSSLCLTVRWLLMLLLSVSGLLSVSLLSVALLSVTLLALMSVL